MQLPRLFAGNERPDSRNAGVLALDGIAIGHRTQLAHALRAERGRRSLRDEGERTRKLDDVQGVAIHYWSLFRACSGLYWLVTADNCNRTGCGLPVHSCLWSVNDIQNRSSSPKTRNQQQGTRIPFRCSCPQHQQNKTRARDLIASSGL